MVVKVPIILYYLKMSKKSETDPSLFKGLFYIMSKIHIMIIRLFLLMVQGMIRKLVVLLRQED